MRLGLIGCGAALTAALGLAACAPGPGGYAGFANYRQRQANQHAYLANRDTQAARYAAAHGNYYGAQRAQQAANAQASAAQAAQAHANRDAFFSRF